LHSVLQKIAKKINVLLTNPAFCCKISISAQMNGGNYMALVNIMEGIVKDKLTEMLKNENCCKCERCVEDMTALALNKLPARYVSTHNGELFSKLNALVRQSTVDLNIAVAEAIACVSKRPSHQ